MTGRRNPQAGNSNRAIFNVDADLRLKVCSPGGGVGTVIPACPENPCQCSFLLQRSFAAFFGLGVLGTARSPMPGAAPSRSGQICVLSSWFQVLSASASSLSFYDARAKKRGNERSYSASERLRLSAWFSFDSDFDSDVKAT